MSAAQYWYETTPGVNTFDIGEHVRQSFWRYGLGTAWFTATTATAPYHVNARWNDLTFTFDWVPQQYVQLRMPHYDKAVEDAFSMVLGFKPIFRYSDGDDNVIEWRQVDRAARWNHLVESGQPNLSRA